MADSSNNQNNEAVMLAGGIALMVFGAGIVLSNPAVRQFLMGQVGGLSESEEPMQGLAAVLPDVERYLRIRAM